jgi:hypothetical protein
VFVTGTDNGLWIASVPAAGTLNGSTRIPAGAATSMQAVNRL